MKTLGSKQFWIMKSFGTKFSYYYLLSHEANNIMFFKSQLLVNLGYKKIGSRNRFWSPPKKFCPKRFFCPKKIFVPKKFGTQKNLEQKNLKPEKNQGPIKIWGLKKYRVLKIQVPKIFWSPKNLSLQKYKFQKIWVPKTLVP